LQKRIDNLQGDDNQRQSTRNQIKAMLTGIYPVRWKLRSRVPQAVLTSNQVELVVNGITRVRASSHLGGQFYKPANLPMRTR
jgi:hypothetical protein